MNASSPPLPVVIGPTENALRALLLSVLDSSPVAGYKHWVAINMVANPDSDQVGAIATGLQCSRREAAVLIEDLQNGGLVECRDEAWMLTESGTVVLASLRRDVAGVTSQLISGLDDSEVAITRQILDVVRTRAIDELARRSKSTPRP